MFLVLLKDLISDFYIESSDIRHLYEYVSMYIFFFSTINADQFYVIVYP